jgi:hypothetical protein
MVSQDEVYACRNELLSLRPIVQKVQQDYQSTARMRVQQQTKVAQIVLWVQQNKHTKYDIPLVEDVIVLALQTETSAKRCETFPEKPSQQPSDDKTTTSSTASAEEAMKIYQQQIQTLQAEHQYRNELLQIERKMVHIYNVGIQQIQDTVREYSSDPQLIMETISKMTH